MSDNNYVLGRGKLFFAPIAPGAQVGHGERYFGNTPELSLTIENEDLPHYNSDDGVREEDASITLQTNRNGAFTTDNIDPNNVALFFFGETFDFVTEAATVAGEAINTVIPGLYYQLGRTPTNPVGAMSLDIHTPEVAGPPVVPAKNIVVTDAEATEYVEGADYTIDMLTGLLYIVPGGAIEAGTNLVVDYKVKSSTRSRTISGSQAIEGSITYRTKNAHGTNSVWYMPRAKITPNGDYNLKGDEWQVIPFSLRVLKLSAYEAIYVDGVPLAA